MGRIDRIRENIVSRVIASDGWWEGNILQTDEAQEPEGSPPSGRQLARHARKRRRQIVELLLDLSVRDLKQD